jgi:hypothetical protein
MCVVEPETEIVVTDIRLAPKNLEQIDALIDRLDADGMEAVAKGIMEHFAARSIAYVSYRLEHGNREVSRRHAPTDGHRRSIREWPKTPGHR